MRYEAFIFDLDGVIWRGQAPIEGAAEGIARLRQAGARTFFCTNNSSRARREFAIRLSEVGIPCEENDVFSSSFAAALYLQREMKPGFSAYVVGEGGLIETLQSIGVQTHTGDDETPCDCVVAGIDRQFTYAKMRIAQANILRGARFVATNRDATFPIEEGVVPGAGSIIAGIALSSGVEPTTVGKPEPIMLRLCLEQFGLDPHKTAMVGDRLDTDVACGHRAGIAGLLVETGVNTRQEGEAAQGEEHPDAIYRDLPALCDDLISDGR